MFCGCDSFAINNYYLHFNKIDLKIQEITIENLRLIIFIVKI